MASDHQEGDETSHRQGAADGSTVGGLSAPCPERNSPQECNESNLSLYFQRLWDSYRAHVQRHQVSLQLLDDVLTRIIFWTPPSSHDLSQRTTRWREVMYGLISLHRLVMDLAVTQDEVVNSYGTTLQPTAPPAVHATAMRILLTVTHNLMPTVLELARSHPQRQTECRLWLERIKFVLRLALLTSYWNQMRNDEPYQVVGGLLRDGGMYYGGMQHTVPTTANVQALKYRREYVGRRTGRRVMSDGEGLLVRDGNEQQNRNLCWMRLMLGEILRLYRPLYWAQAERDESRSGSSHGLWKAWVATLVMEVISLKCLCGPVSRDNPASQAELSRRRMKVLLCLLRSPVWDRTTEPSVMRTAAIVRRVPLVGRLVETYLWEWLLYWKHPFVSEEE